MWLSGSLTLTLTDSSFSRHQSFGRGEEWAFSSPKYWNTSVLTIDLSCFYISKNLFSEITEVEKQIFQGKKEESFEKRTFPHAHTHTHTHTHTHARTHAHTYTHISRAYTHHIHTYRAHTRTHTHITPHHTQKLGFSTNYNRAYPPLFVFVFDSHQVCYVWCYVMSY